MSSPHSPNQNHLLAALPTAEFEPLAAYLELVAMPLGEILYEPGGQMQHAYFPTTAIVSLHYVMASGASAESAGVGNEGVVGISLLSPCVLRFRRRDGRRFRRFSLDAQPRSVYLLNGEIRHEWEHSIAPMETRRYSITFRSRKESAAR